MDRDNLPLLPQQWRVECDNLPLLSQQWRVDCDNLPLLSRQWGVERDNLPLLSQQWRVERDNLPLLAPQWRVERGNRPSSAMARAYRLVTGQVVPTKSGAFDRIRSGNGVVGPERKVRETGRWCYAAA